MSFNGGVDDEEEPEVAHLDAPEPGCTKDKLAKMRKDPSLTQLKLEQRKVYEETQASYNKNAGAWLSNGIIYDSEEADKSEKKPKVVANVDQPPYALMGEDLGPRRVSRPKVASESASRYDSWVLGAQAQHNSSRASKSPRKVADAPFATDAGSAPAPMKGRRGQEEAAAAAEKYDKLVAEKSLAQRQSRNHRQDTSPW